MKLEASLVILSIALLPSMLEFMCQQSFTVHNQGGVVLTGASSGIGKHAAGALADLGYTVFAGVRKQADATALQAQYPSMRPVILDVTAQESIDDAFKSVMEQLMALKLPLVALVNNAGVQKDLPVELQDPQADRFTFDVNVFGLLDVTRTFLPSLRRTGDGARVVNVGSLAGRVGAAGSATYVGSKYAVEGITDCLRMELNPFGVSVSLLEPGYVASDMAGKFHSRADYGVTADEYSLYQHVFEGFFVEDKKMGLPENAAPPSVTTNAIIHAITSANPQTRYVVAQCGPFPAWLVNWLWTVLPDRAMDIVLA